MIKEPSRHYGAVFELTNAAPVGILARSALKFDDVVIRLHHQIITSNPDKLAAHLCAVRHPTTVDTESVGRK